MVLFVLFLYQTLPQLVPRSTLEFVGKLGEKQVSCSIYQSWQISLSFLAVPPPPRVGPTQLALSNVCLSVSLWSQVQLAPVATHKTLQYLQTQAALKSAVCFI